MEGIGKEMFEEWMKRLMERIDRLDSIISVLINKEAAGMKYMDGERYELQARLSLQKAEDGKLKLTPHFVRHEPRLDVPYNGYTFTDEDKQALKQTSNLGKLVNVADSKTGEMRLTIFSENINAHLSYLNY